MSLHSYHSLSFFLSLSLSLSISLSLSLCLSVSAVSRRTWSSLASRSMNRSNTSFSTSPTRAVSRSTLLITRMTGSPCARAYKKNRKEGRRAYTFISNDREPLLLRRAYSSTLTSTTNTTMIPWHRLASIPKKKGGVCNYTHTRTFFATN